MRVPVLAATLTALASAGVTTAHTTALARAPSTATPALLLPVDLITGSAGQQTHPAVVPRTGHAHTRFIVRMTLADAPGHAGVLATDYRLQLSAPRGRTNRTCLPGPLANIDSGLAHQVVRIGLRAPVGGWCTGRYTLTVFLQRGPYCPKPVPGQPPTACPEFATQELDVGQASFSVTGRG